MKFILFKKCIYEFNPVQERQVYSRNTYMNLTLFQKYKTLVWFKPCSRNKCMNNPVHEIHLWIYPCSRNAWMNNTVHEVQIWTQRNNKGLFVFYQYIYNNLRYSSTELSYQNKFNHQSNLFGPTNPTILCLPEPRFLKKSRGRYYRFLI